MCEDRDERIEELVEKFRRKLQESFPRKGSWLDEIEHATEKIGKAIEAEIEGTAIGDERERNIDNWEAIGNKGSALALRREVMRARQRLADA